MKDIKKDDSGFMMSESLIGRLDEGVFLGERSIDKNLSASILYDDESFMIKDIYAIENSLTQTKISFLASPAESFQALFKKINHVSVKISDNDEVDIGFDKENVESSATLSDLGSYICQIVLTRI